MKTMEVTNKQIYDYTHLAAQNAKRQDSFLGRLLGRNKPRVNNMMGNLAGLLAGMAGGAMPATYGYLGGYPGGTNKGQVGFTEGALTIVNINWDFKAIAAARSAAGQAAITTGDVLQLFKTLANSWVIAVFCKPTTAEGAAMTIDVGDVEADDSYIDAGSINATTMLSSLITTANSLATAGGKFYAADEILQFLTNNATPGTAVLNFFFVVADLRSYRA